MRMTTRHLVRGAMIAALYVAIALALRPIAFGPLQFRVSEALTALPMLLPEAIPGLTVGCLLANLFGSEAGPLDVVFGTLATLISALLTYGMRKKLNWHPALCMLPPVLINAVVVGAVLHVTLGVPLFLTMLEVGIGQLGACYLLGLPLHYLIQKVPDHLLQ